MDDEGGAIERNLRTIRLRIAAAAARVLRDPSSIHLIAVTKSVGIPEIETLIRLGVTHLGENRVHTAEPKIDGIHADVIWHMIGNIQRRKAKDVVRLFQRVDAVDRIELAGELAKRVSSSRALPILLEVNISGEAAKHGFAPDEVDRALDTIAGFASLHVDGVMTMAPLDRDPERARPVFAALYQLADRFGLKRVSMGMSNDFEVAVEEGATEVRIGSALFEN